MIKWIIGSLIDTREYKTERCFTWQFLFFQLMALIILMGWFLYNQHFLRKGVKKSIKFFDVHAISTLIIYFLKSLLHKSSYTISWIYYNLYHIYNVSPFLIRHNVFGLLRHTVHEDTSAKNHKCSAHYICSICISLIYLYLIIF